MLTVDNAKFNGRRPVFNFWATISAFLQFSGWVFYFLLYIFFNWDYSDYGTTWRLSGEHARPITGPR